MGLLEEWRRVTIPGYEKYYEVSNLGNVRSSERVIQASNRLLHYKTRPLRVNEDSRGYLQVCLCDHGRRTTVLVHRLVAMSFLGYPPEGTEVCHNNGDRQDNRVENLRWDTRSSNTIDKLKHGTHNWLESNGGHLPDEGHVEGDF